MAESSTQPAPEDSTTAPTAESAPEPDLTGQTFGDFRILRRLGQGGMGQVYLAEQISLKRHVAFKVLKRELAANETSLKRFQQEAHSVARVTHANIVQIYAIQETSGLHYMALEFVEGKNLREFLEKKGTPDVLLGLSIMSQIAKALQRANELGIVHRDIKPENILLTRKGEVKVADFGLSRCFREDKPANLTQSNVTMGTPLYMSPEQVEGKRTIDHRSDIYSFGVTCYHMFAGHPPFRGTSPFEVAVQHVQKTPPPLKEIRPDLPGDLCTIIHKMMSKQPEARYQTAREILGDVSRLRDAVVVAGTTAVAATLSASSADLASEIAASGVHRPARSSRSKALLIGLIPIALGLGMAVGYFRPPGGPSTLPAGPDPEEEEPAPLKASFSPTEQEKLLLRNWQDSVRPGPKLDELAGLKHAIDLGLFYLKQSRLDDADRFFQELLATDNVRSYRALGSLGKAMVLAFRDQPGPSNTLFVKMLDRGDKTFDKLAAATAPTLRSYPALREMMAKALHFNFVNEPLTFPAALEAYLHPPRPQGK